MPEPEPKNMVEVNTVEMIASLDRSILEATALFEQAKEKGKDINAEELIRNNNVNQFNIIKIMYTVRGIALRLEEMEQKLKQVVH